MTLSFSWWLWPSFSFCWQWFPWFWLSFRFAHFLRQTLLWTFCYRFPHLLSAIILLESSLAKILSYFLHSSWDLLGVFILNIPGIGQNTASWFCLLYVNARPSSRWSPYRVSNGSDDTEPSAFGFSGLSGIFLPFSLRVGPSTEGTLGTEQETGGHSFLSLSTRSFPFGQKGFILTPLVLLALPLVKSSYFPLWICSF